MTDMDENERLAAGLRKALNTHGYSYQYAVLEEGRRLNAARKSPWIFEVAEFPVNASGRDTQVDFILRHCDKPIYLIAECKRANPALADWCFAKAPYVGHNWTHDPYVVERVHRDADGKVVSLVFPRFGGQVS